MKEPRGGAEKKRGDRHLPRRPPGERDGAAGQRGGAAADHDGQQDDLQDAFAGIERVHCGPQRVPPSR